MHCLLMSFLLLPAKNVKSLFLHLLLLLNIFLLKRLLRFLVME